MLNILVLLSIAATLPLILYAPVIGVLAWHWIALMNPHRLAWEAVASLPVAAVVGAATLGMWLLSRERKTPPRDPIIAVLVVLALWITVTTVFAIERDAALPIWDRAIKILLFTFVTAAVVTNLARLTALIWIMVLSIGFFSVKGGLFTLLTGGDHRVWGPPNTFIADNNTLAMAILMTLPFFWYLAQNTGLKVLRWAMLGGFALSIVAIGGSFSRGALVALVAVGGFLVLKSRYKISFSLLGIVAAGFLVSFMPAHWLDRIASIADYENDQSAQGRFDAWMFAVRLIGERPVFGGGFRVYYDSELFMRLVPDAIKSRAWHSNYFQILGEHGLIGLALFATLFLLAWLRAGQIARLGAQHGIGWARDLGDMCKISLVGYATAGLFVNMAFFNLYYILLAVIVVGYRIAAGEANVAVLPGRRTGRRPNAEGAPAIVREATR